MRSFILPQSIQFIRNKSKKHLFLWIVSAVFTTAPAVRAEECAWAWRPDDRGGLLWHYPWETGPEEPAGRGRLQYRSRPGPQRITQHCQHTTGVVSLYLCQYAVMDSVADVKREIPCWWYSIFCVFVSPRCAGCETVLCGIEEQVSRANQYRESQLKVKVQVETEVCVWIFICPKWHTEWYNICDKEERKSSPVIFNCFNII